MKANELTGKDFLNVVTFNDYKNAVGSSVTDANYSIGSVKDIEAVGKQLLQPNSLLLVKRNTEGNITKFVNFGVLRDSKDLTMLQELITYLASDVRLANSLNAEFTSGNKKDLLTTLLCEKSTKPFLREFLNTTRIYRVNSDLKVAKALEVKSGVLKDLDALKMKHTDAIVLCKDQRFGAICKNQASLALAQMERKEMLIKTVESAKDQTVKQEKIISEKEIATA